MTDAELVARVLDGHAADFAVLVERYHADCRRFARHMLGNEQDAEDATQEAFVRAYTGLGRYDERSHFRAWLYRILLNQCRTLARQRGRRDRRFVQDPGLVEGAAAATGEGRGELRDSLAAALAVLEPRMREAFLLKYGEGMEYAEMARITGAGVSALKMRVKRAVAIVRPRLEELLRG
jgi:RNA polymerase sigma-70 factor (ECF subfamily)